MASVLSVVILMDQSSKLSLNISAYWEDQEACTITRSWNMIMQMRCLKSLTLSALGNSLTLLAPHMFLGRMSNIRALTLADISPNMLKQIPMVVKAINKLEGLDLESTGFELVELSEGMCLRSRNAFPTLIMLSHASPLKYNSLWKRSKMGLAANERGEW